MKTIILLPLVALLASCEDQGALVTSEPSMSDIAGHYEISNFNFNTKVDGEIATKASSAHIDINSDGTLLFNNIPVVSERNDAPFVIERFHTGTGTYSIAPLGSTSNSEFYGLYIICGDMPEPMNTPRLRIDDASMMLSFEYFDGDFIQRLAFTRTTKKQHKPEIAAPRKPSD
jgi:hypothetical protein